MNSIAHGKNKSDKGWFMCNASVLPHRDNSIAMEYLLKGFVGMFYDRCILQDYVAPSTHCSRIYREREEKEGQSVDAISNLQIICQEN